ncbi:MAG TPA: hypothetical protein VH619_06415, partial [Verrucomicrobiae bacterium]|nr:hypothetical protein [Verrucomicrobiae bacterium]
MSTLRRRFYFFTFTNCDDFKVVFGQIISHDQHFIEGQLGLDCRPLEWRGLAVCDPTTDRAGQAIPKTRRGRKVGNGLGSLRRRAGKVARRRVGWRLLCGLGEK